jgi:hypothetical protein
MTTNCSLQVETACSVFTVKCVKFPWQSGANWPVAAAAAAAKQATEFAIRVGGAQATAGDISTRSSSSTRTVRENRFVN